MIDGISGGDHVTSAGIDVAGSWQYEIPFEQARILTRGDRRPPEPGIGPEVMVIAARRHEQRAGAPHGLVETERPVGAGFSRPMRPETQYARIKLNRPVELTHLEPHDAH